MKSLVILAVCAVTLCLHSVQALSYGGGTCNFGTSGVAACTSTSAGFCSLDTVTVTGSPATAVVFAGKCICYPNYSGTVCGTQTVTSTTTSTTNNALGVLAIGALAAYFLSGAGNVGTGIGAGAAAGNPFLMG
ncbi:uncharacterized protein LOC125659155 isoform X2 [Ostrea edulis]|nr:uncharacterized protein LOC125659155 isoform X2 [Ostrea edulis]